MPLVLDASKALIFRITHIENVEWILNHGLCCASGDCLDPNFVPIGNRDLIKRRSTRAVPIEPRGSLSDYVPFYFTPWSTMLFKIVTGHEGTPQVERSKIVTLIASCRDLMQSGQSVVFTDRHAYLRPAKFFADVGGLNEIDWAILQARDFKADTDDPEKISRYQAEALVHRRLDPTRIIGLACHSETQRASLEALVKTANSKTRVVQRNWFFA